jgi:heme/copper-type cytochrome/quinol oxidase subunit 1
MLYFLIALGIGVLSIGERALDLGIALPPLAPIYFHAFLVGWVTQLIFGVAYWMFPKHSKEQPRGSEPLAWATFWLLNLGLLLRVAIEPLHSQSPDRWLGWLLALSALMQWLAGMSFIVNTWPRVKER